MLTNASSYTTIKLNIFKIIIGQNVFARKNTKVKLFIYNSMRKKSTFINVCGIV